MDPRFLQSAMLQLFARGRKARAGQTRSDREPSPPTLLGIPRGPRPPQKQGGAIALRSESPAREQADLWKRKIGDFSKRWEVGPNGGPGTVSSGRNDPGGVSYGSWQFATNSVHPRDFLRTEGGPWAPIFQGHRPGSPEFSRRWRGAAMANGPEFEEAQREYTRRTHFDRQVGRTRQATGFDARLQSAVVQDAIWSTAVQHNNNTPSYVSAALARVPFGPDDPRFEAAFLRALYAERARRVPGQRNRYTEESDAAVRRLAEDGGPKSELRFRLVPRAQN